MLLSIDTPSAVRHAAVIYASLLRGELSAIDAYLLALARVGHHLPDNVRECLHSHEERATLIAEHIIDLGGTPSTDAGAWGAFTLAMEGGAAVFGPASALAVLEEGEEHGMACYRTALADMPAESAGLIIRTLLPEQARTHALIGMIRSTWRSA